MRWTASSRALPAALAAFAGMGFAANAAAFSLTSTAFSADALIPQRHTCDGGESARATGWADTNAGVSPPLLWQAPPSGTKTFALLLEDPDAPGGNWVHWVLYDIPGNSNALAEGAPKDPTLRDGSKQGRNDFRNPYYQGPCPPRGDPPHRYVFTLYALDGTTGLQPGASRTQLLQAIQKRTLGKATLVGRYGR
jgi:Raf kinase inhibitor-like YbhB/YbcL family protein